MSEDQAPTPRAPKAKAKPEVETTKFIFIGDLKDSGRGSRAPRDDDDMETGTSCNLYGYKFPIGRAVAVPLDAKIGTSSMLIVDKLRGNSHFFEGEEAELKAAKDAGQIAVVKARPKTPVLVKYAGMRRKDLPTEDAHAMDD
jgi:hypothetical protein